MATPTSNGRAPYNWDTDDVFTAGPDGTQTKGAKGSGRQTWSADDMHTGNPGGSNGNGGGAGTASASAPGGGHHQGDRLIAAVERIEFTSEKDIYALAKAINHLGRELHLILGMRAEELNGVLSQYRGKWYHFGAASRVKARLVSAHLKVSAEAAKAIGVGALKMSHSFNRHFIQPEQEAKAKAGGKKPTRKTFTIGDV
ncbi:hypothetical protein [Streptomyces mangrovi]|uniref:hypothetical protein n=1 Tax=Streptomyces mangrovi TaxID=1206892 RepID=UPI00399CB151